MHRLAFLDEEERRTPGTGYHAVSSHMIVAVRVLIVLSSTLAEAADLTVRRSSAESQAGAVEYVHPIARQSTLNTL